MDSQQLDEEPCDVISVPEVARRLKISKTLVYEGIRAGRIPGIQVGERRVIVPKQQFEAWLLGNLAVAG